MSVHKPILIWFVKHLRLMKTYIHQTKLLYIMIFIYSMVDLSMRCKNGDI